MKVVLPVAGKGERMRPYTNELPKCLLPVGDKTIADWIIADTLALNPSETIFIAGYKAEAVEEFLRQRPQLGASRIVLQNNPQGLGQAISLVLPYVEDNEPLLIILGDTLFQADISWLANATENILYTYQVDDPRRFGVAETDEMGNIKRLVEKPQEFVSDKALVGIYYIKDVKELKCTLKYLMENDVRTRGEIQLTDALQMMLQNGCKFKTAMVQEWLDCGLPETLIQTNTWLLQNKPGLNNIKEVEFEASIHNVKLVSPCYIGKNVTIANSVIGPNVTIGDNCTVWNSVLKDCVVWDGESVCCANIEKQIVASVKSQPKKGNHYDKKTYSIV